MPLSHLALLLPVAALAAQPDYFPLQTGNQWTYRVAAQDRSFTLEVTGTQTHAGQTYYTVEGFRSGTAWLRMAEDGTLYAWDAAKNAEAVWVKFGAADGVAFDTAIDSCVKSGTIVSHAAKLTVPTGQFDTALEVGYTPGACADAGLTSEFYLPYVGLMQHTETSIAGPVVYDLVYARLNYGLTVVTAGEQSFTVALDNSVYTAAQPAAARLTLRNTQPQPLALAFPSGQRFDVVVRNSGGQSVYQWSATRFFVAQYTTLSLNGEKTWAVTFPVPDTPGQYTAEVSLATQPLLYNGQVGFTVK
jgi:hypothetical protein